MFYLLSKNICKTFFNLQCIFLIVLFHVDYFLIIMFEFFVAVKKEKPELLKKPDDIEVMESEDVRFEATIKGKPEPTIQWYVTKQSCVNVFICNVLFPPNTPSECSFHSDEPWLV